jgi:hypothetical protein
MSSAELTLALDIINYKSGPTAYPYCSGMEYEEIYDWLVAVRESSGGRFFLIGSSEIRFYLVRCLSIGWVKYKDTKMVEDFLEENYL